MKHLDKSRYPEKFVSLEMAFSHIRRGDRIFIGTGCGEPQFLVQSMVDYVQNNPKSLFDAEVMQVWTLDVAPYTDKKYRSNFRHNSFFIGRNTREAINSGAADYTPIFLSHIPKLFKNGHVPIDVALIQVSSPDEHGFMSLGVTCDITKSAIEAANVVIAQINPKMPRVHGDGFIHIDNINFAFVHEEELLTYAPKARGEVVKKIGKFVASIIKDGDTIQVGYGSIPNAILASLMGKKHLGVHTELLGDGLVELIKAGIVDNSKKTINTGRTTASFCMGNATTFDYIDDNPSIEFRTIEYTNNPKTIAQHDNMVAINQAMEIDMTGQSTAESIGKMFYSGIGGQADFMRAAALSEGGRTILAMTSTTDDESISKIVPFLREGAGVTLNRGDIHYVVTEYGIAYLHGKSIRERAMELIAIAHPKFRSQLIQQAKDLNLIYKDQAFIPGKRGEYPEHLETFRTTKKGQQLLLRPVKISDEPILKDFFYSLSDESIYKRFISSRTDMPHERLQEFVIIDYTKETVINAIIKDGDKEEIVGVGQYGINENTHTAEVAFVVRDEMQDEGIGQELLSYLTFLAKKQGLFGFTAEVLTDNKPMLYLFEKMGFDIERKRSEGVYELKMLFRN